MCKKYYTYSNHMDIQSYNKQYAALQGALKEVQKLSKEPIHQLPKQIPHAQTILQNLNAHVESYHMPAQITTLTPAQAADMHNSINNLLIALQTVFPNYMQSTGRGMEEKMRSLLATLLPTLSDNLKKLDEDLKRLNRRKYRFGDKVEKVEEAKETKADKERP